MTNSANKIERIHLSLDAELFAKVSEMSELTKVPGNAPPKPQAVIRRIIAEYFENQKTAFS